MLSMLGWCSGDCGPLPCEWKLTTATVRPSRSGCAVIRRLPGCIIPAWNRIPSPSLFRRQMKHGGALLSFELAGGEAAACRFLDRLGLILHAVSLGGMESLATRPAMSSHRGMTSEARHKAGVSDSLIRLSVGVEAIEDLFADLQQALAG